MTIGPVSNSHREISVTEPVSPALERVKTMLFQPFDLGKWFTIGFCAWLAYLGEGGGSGGFNSGVNSSVNNNNHGSAAESFRHTTQQARDYVLNNIDWIVPVAAAAIMFLLALWFLIIWLSSRGRFMFLHCVALNTAVVAEPWSKYGREADSLFWFRAVLGFSGMVLTLPALGFAALLVFRMVLHNAVDAPSILLAVGLCLLFFMAAIVLVLIQKFTFDFVVPIMFLRRCGCLAAWKEFGQLVSGRIGLFILYLVFQFVLAMMIGMIVTLALLFTCCFCCFALLPYIGTVILLPVLVFKQSYPLYFLRQFGPDYDVFQTKLSAPPATGIPQQPDMP